MQCRQCKFQNPPGMKFCGECGAELQIVCDNCNAPNPSHFKFCGECGSTITSQAQSDPTQGFPFDEKLASLRKYLPSGLTQKILSQKDKIAGERRQVTIMSVDMKGLGPLTEALSPNEARSLMDEAFEKLVLKVHEFEGTVNESRGEGVLAFFGAPLALEDSPQRAIYSALAIHREMARFSEKIKRERQIPPVQLRIGINSGPVVVGSVGSDLRVQFNAVGDTLDMAAQMEQLAGAGSIYVTDETFRLTEGLFRFEALGEKEISGKEEPAKVYRVIAPNSRRTRFDVSAERGLTRFVGRQRELEILLDGFERSRGCRGQAVSIVGEAGVGKSRLLYEFRKAISNEDVAFLEGRCLSYSKGLAYHPIIEVVKSNFGVEDDDEDSIIRDKLRSGLSTLGLDEASTLPYLLELLALKDSGVDSLRMSQEAKKDRILDSLRRKVLKESEKRLMVLAFEDLHLMDKSSEETVKYLLESIPGARVLMIFTYRPEFVHTWGGRSFHSQVTLNRLSNRESLAMVAHLLGDTEVSPDLQELILEKTEGIPFFIEEFVRTLRDMAVIEGPDQAYHLGKDIDRVAIPSTIQDIILARVDSLPEAPKEVLHVGSAIEREFAHELIKEVADYSEQELLSHLSVLKEAELLYERGIFPQATYVFKHTITREVVYNSMLADKKKMLHRKIGKTIEELYRESLDAYYSILADHFMVSEDFQESADYSRLTYERTRKQAALPSAISYAQKRVAALERLPLTAEIESQLIDARTQYALTLFMTGDPAGAKEAIEPIVEMTQNSEDKGRLAQINLILGAYQFIIQENLGPGFELLQKAIRNAEEAADVTLATLAHFFYGTALCWDSQFDEGAQHIQIALRVNEAAQNLWGVSVMNSYLSYYAYNYKGKVEEGFATSLQAVEIAESSGDILSRAMAYVCHGISCFYKGFFPEAQEHLLKGISLCERIQSDAIAAIGHQGLGYAFFETGDYSKSETHHRKAIQSRRRTGIYPSCLDLNRIALARTVGTAGNADLDIPSLVQLLGTDKSRLYYGIMARHLAEILCQRDQSQFSEAESWLQEAVLNHERLGMKWDLARDYILLARLLKLQGRTAEEKDCLDKALLLFNECGAEGWCRNVETGFPEG
ncbi:MAG: AAA family ATPase [Desulfomonile tiedjei]|nr:AAA family ATPase [Desulfomonile tiedjei]